MGADAVPDVDGEVGVEDVDPVVVQPLQVAVVGITVVRAGCSGSRQNADGKCCAETGGSDEFLHSSGFLSFALFCRSVVDPRSAQFPAPRRRTWPYVRHKGSPGDLLGQDVPPPNVTSRDGFIGEPPRWARRRSCPGVFGARRLRWRRRPSARCVRHPAFADDDENVVHFARHQPTLPGVPTGTCTPSQLHGVQVRHATSAHCCWGLSGGAHGGVAGPHTRQGRPTRHPHPRSRQR